jgi:SulP family sulfate permease
MLTRFLPILQWLPNYQRSWLSGDISAGLTVGIMLIPQGMAYAMIAGLPAVFGLYAALMPQVVYAVLGTSRQLAVGPVAMDSLLVAAGLGSLKIAGMDEYVALAVFLAMFMGAIQLGLGLFRMGFLVNFLSKPVISGFTSAAAIIIGLSQLKHLIGTDIERSNQIHILLSNAFDTLQDTNLVTLSVGIAGIVIIKVFKKYLKKIPAALVVVVAGIVAVYFLGLHDYGVKIVEEVPSGLPAFKVPTIARVSELLPIALTLALIAFMEAISVAKAVEERHDDYEIDPNQELIALGAANVIGSFFQSYPGTGGFSRTAVNDQAGAKTGVSPLISAVVVGLTLLFLTPLFYYLPNAVLASIIMVAVFGLIDVKYPRQLWKTRKDEFGLLIATFLITLTVGIKEGILIGVLLSLLLMLYRTSKPHIAILGRVKGTDYFKNITRFSEETEQHPEILAMRFDSELYFGNKDYFKKEVLKQVTAGKGQVRHFILNAESINYIDSSSVHMLSQLIAELKKQGIAFYIAGAIGPVRDVLHDSGLIDTIGRKHLFVRVSEAWDYCLEEKGKSDIQRKVALQTKRDVSWETPH